MIVHEGEILDHSYIFCPLCDYRTGVSRWSYGVENAQGALASHLHRKKHAMPRREALELAKQQQVVPKGTLIPARTVGSSRTDVAVGPVVDSHTDG